MISQPARAGRAQDWHLSSESGKTDHDDDDEQIMTATISWLAPSDSNARSSPIFVQLWALELCHN